MKRCWLLMILLAAASLACLTSTPAQPTSDAAVETALGRLIVAATQTQRARPTQTPLPTLAPTFTSTPAPAAIAPTAALSSPTAPLVTAEETSAPVTACIPDRALEPGLVTRVMDSSTIEVFVNGKLVIVRYIGVQPPNTYSLKEAATAKNKEWVEGQSVVLIRDISSVDEQGRLLRYVLVGSLEGTFINYELVRQGYTQTVRIAPDLACAETLGQAQMQAAQDEVGIWSPELMASPTPRPTHAPGWMSLPEGAKVKDTPRWCSPLCR